MLRARGAETQSRRRQSPELDVFYSDDPHDLGNIADYDEFLERLVGIYAGSKAFLQPTGLPDHHRQERQKGRQDLPAGVGSRPAA